VLFTSGATEGIQTAVLSALCAVRERRAAGAVGDLLVYGATEHKAVSESLAHWNRLLGTGLTLCALPVDGAGGTASTCCANWRRARRWSAPWPPTTRPA
jgi:cysteine desulfurase